MSLLQVRGLTVGLPVGSDRENAITDVSFDMRPGEVLCIVGESGSGKSVSAAAVMGLLPSALTRRSGDIRLDGESLLGLSPAAMRDLRGRRLGMIFQEPMTALNPLMRVGDQVAEVLSVHGVWNASARVAELLEAVKLPDPARIASCYPHMMSGGQRQRVMIAMAIALEPALLIADEPTTALDVITQMEVLRLIKDIQTRRGTSVLFITHDFGVVADIADHVAVMRQGIIVEAGTASRVLNHPEHPYTLDLINAVPYGCARVQAVVGAPILEAKKVRKTYYRGAGLFKAGTAVPAIVDVDFSVRAGETLGLVGESGSGKSTLARSIVGLVKPEGGEVMYNGTDLLRLDRQQWKPFRKRIQMVFQDPFASLNPRRRVGEIIANGPIAHGEPREQALAQAAELLKLVRLDPSAMHRFPHEFSGGQRQRIGIARALAMEPEILIADEPVSALDVSVQREVLALLESLRKRLGLTMVFVTHDLRVAAQICGRIAVMQRGRIVEYGDTETVFKNPQHDYTRLLLSSIPGRGWIPPVSKPQSGEPPAPDPGRSIP